MCLSLGSSGNPLEKHISEAEKLLNKYEVKLNEYNGNASKVQTDFVPLSEVSLADEAWHNKMTEGERLQDKLRTYVLQITMKQQMFFLRFQCLITS